MIEQETIDAVLTRASVVDLVAEQVQLKRRGRSFVGLCPFHSERTPSFHVNEDGRFFHCFGCGVSGGVIEFVMRTRGLSFPEAVEELATRLGVVVKRSQGREGPVEKDVRPQLFKLQRIASEFYQAQLKASSFAMQYLRERGVGEQAIETFQLGFAPPAWRELSNFLHARKVPEDLIVRAGLAKRNARGELFDVFRGRLMIPILADGGRVLGFGGRMLTGIPGSTAGEGEGPKYLNSAESSIYHKSNVLFGLPQALEAARRSQEIVLVEGYFDVIGLWQSGLTHCIATCGTAVTEEHARRLKRLVRRVSVFFDGDGAGRAAAGKCFPVFLNSGLDLSAVFLPTGEDPDTWARAQGDNVMQGFAALQRAPLLDCYLQNLLTQEGIERAGELGAAAKGRVAAQLAETLARVQNEVERADLLERAAARLGAAAADMLTLVRAKPAGARRPTAALQVKGEELLKEGVVTSPASSLSEPAQAAAAPAAISSLPRLDQEVLLYVMAGYQSASAKRILEDPDLSGELRGDSIAFIQSLQLTVDRAGEDVERLKAGLRQLLQRFGKSWVDHWKLARKMSADDGADFERALSQCVVSVKRAKFRRLLDDLDVERRSESDPKRVEELLNQRLELLKRQRETGTSAS